MKYVLLIYTDQLAYAAESSVDYQRSTDYDAYDAAARQEAVLLAAETLYPITVATTIRVRDGKTLITDGPFAETPDQLSGYYVLDCLDESVAAHWAVAHPGLHDGTIEIRPVMPFA